MSTTKTKEELVRLSWLTELRRQGHRKCTGALSEGSNVCAIGLLAEVAGVPLDQADDECAEAGDFFPVGKLAGLTREQTELVWIANDGAAPRRPGDRLTFAEIADEVASWFPNG